ncbi:hypothetical protein B0H11DRAFT_1910434 [Mycena galericulata]|nr:hypothetical protein B0H11DRAFT_1910434 [Mycena galericulata]
MKSFHKFVAAALLVAHLSDANAAAVKGSTTPVSVTPSMPVSVTPSTPHHALNCPRGRHPSMPVSVTPSTPVSVTPSTPVSVTPSTVVSIAPSTTPVSVTPHPPKSSPSAFPTGGLVVTGIYTTCLEVNFPAPTFESSASPSEVAFTTCLAFLPAAAAA